MYSHATCTLCDKLKKRIAPFLEKYGVMIETVDIKQDRTLLKTYRYRIPVLRYLDEDFLEGNPSDDQIAIAFNRFDD